MKTCRSCTNGSNRNPLLFDISATASPGVDFFVALPHSFKWSRVSVGTNTGRTEKSSLKAESSVGKCIKPEERSASINPLFPTFLLRLRIWFVLVWIVNVFPNFWHGIEIFYPVRNEETELGLRRWQRQMQLRKKKTASTRRSKTTITFRSQSVCFRFGWSFDILAKTLTDSQLVSQFPHF